MSKRKNTQQLENISAEVLAELTAEAVAEAKAEEQTAEQSTEAAEQSAEAFQLATDKELAELSAVAKTFVIRNEHFHMMIENNADLQSAQGEGTDDSILIGRYGYGSNGKGELVSVWCRRKKSERKATLLSADSTTQTEKHSFPCDFGLRFSRDDFEMFNSITECSELLQTAYNEHTEIKHNEPRFSFQTLHSLTELLAKLYNSYDVQQTAEEQSTEQTAEEQTETKQKSRSRKEQKQMKA